jgi:hypothetical protein
VCQIRVLVIGNSAGRNVRAIERLRDRLEAHLDVCPSFRIVDPSGDEAVDPSEHDMALVDDGVFSKGCSRFVLGSRLPILAFADAGGDDEVASSVIGDAVELGRLRDRIEETMGHIEQTRRMLSTFA